VITGRIESRMDETMQTLQDSGLRSFTLLMRPDDSVDTIQFKAEQAARLQESYEVTHVFENDADARIAYERLGLTAIDPSAQAAISKSRSKNA